MAETTQGEATKPETVETPEANKPETASADAANSGNGKRQSPRTKPAKFLATDRIQFPKRQFDTLRAFVIAASKSEQPASLSEVAPLANLSVNTLSVITTFFVNANLITKSEGNKFAPTSESIEYERSYNWNPETAAHALMPALENTWFAKTILSHLKVRGTMTMQEASELLASEAVASPEYKPQIRITIDWLVMTGVLDRDGEVLKMARRGHFKPAPHSAAPPPKPEADKHVEHVPPAPRQQQTTDEAGRISLNVAISIDVRELSTMTPERITAFFHGLAEVVSAKGSLVGG